MNPILQGKTSVISVYILNIGVHSSIQNVIKDSIHAIMSEFLTYLQ